VVSFTARLLYPREKEELVGSKTGLNSGKEKSLMSLAKIEPRFLGRPLRCIVTIPNVLSRLISIHTR